MILELTEMAHSQLSERRQLWDRHELIVLERSLSHKKLKTNKGSKKRQGPTLDVRFTEMSVKRE